MDLLSALEILKTWASDGKNSEIRSPIICLFAQANKRTVVKWQIQATFFLRLFYQ